MEFFSPTLDFNVGALRQIPLPVNIDTKTRQDLSISCKSNIAIGRADWDSHETSWDFASPPLLRAEHRQPTLKASYQLRTHWREMTLEMQRTGRRQQPHLHRRLRPAGRADARSAAGGDHAHLQPALPLWRRQDRGRAGSPAAGRHHARAGQLRRGLHVRPLQPGQAGADPGQPGETLADYLAQVLQPSFPADDDNAMATMNAYGDSRDDDWFADDIAFRFRQFLRGLWGRSL